MSPATIRPTFVFQTSIIATIVLVLFVFSRGAVADDSTNKIREGMRLYSAEQYEEASKLFAAASESFEKAKSDKAAIAAFDEACALHRKGDLELARERYLKAGLSQGKGIATSAHFNIGVIASEQARKLAGEKPETVPADKRKEILDEIGRSIDSYRHCLELQPQHSQARHNLELLRQWTKYYSDRWREADLQKRRDETNLIQFLEYLSQVQLSQKHTSEGLGPNASPNSFAELKRVQEELRDEIPYLKDKIDSELRPKEEDAQDKEDIERGIALLSSWADEAGTRMANAGKDLMKREATAAAENQQRAADQLDQIWDAVVPFHPLLANELTQQTQIAKQLTPPPPTEGQTDLDDSSEKSEESESQQPQQKLEVNDQDWSQLLKKQERVLRKARLLQPKAESELSQVESQPDSQPKGQLKEDENTNVAPPTEGENAEAKPEVDPEAIKAGYQKAIELAPKAVEEMEAAVKQLGKRDRQLSATHAEEARRILQEIQDAQPKNPDQDQDQKEQNKDQDKDQKQDNEQENDKDQDKDKKDDEGKDSKEEKNKNDEKKQDKQQDEDKKDKDKSTEKRQEPKVSQDRIEEALRRVREREQEKRERDRELRARVLGRVPVDKDW